MYQKQCLAHIVGALKVFVEWMTALSPHCRTDRAGIGDRRRGCASLLAGIPERQMFAHLNCMI
jgi:hypothetical protein